MEADAGATNVVETARLALYFRVSRKSLRRAFFFGARAKGNCAKKLVDGSAVADKETAKKLRPNGFRHSAHVEYRWECEYAEHVHQNAERSQTTYIPVTTQSVTRLRDLHLHHVHTLIDAPHRAVLCAVLFCRHNVTAVHIIRRVNVIRQTCFCW